MGLCRRLSGLSSTSRHRAADAQMLIELATAIQLLLWPHYIILPSSSTDNSIALPILLGSWCFCLGGRNFTLTLVCRRTDNVLLACGTEYIFLHTVVFCMTVTTP
ncbi:hypothetical protein Pelo_18496 [Pelomyxa schiedti]|nr:hypothetical protein Pelo_18496 [Pelomyxa schiedti]